VAARAVEAAQMVGLDICGVDVVCESVLQPLEEQSGGIVEVNAAPACACTSALLRQGPRRRQAIIDHMFPTGATAASRWSPSPAPTARPPPCA
jgi:cyanophycin synthetase